MVGGWGERTKSWRGCCRALWPRNDKFALCPLLKLGNKMLLIPSATGDLHIAPPQNKSNNGSPEEDDWVTGTPARLPVPGPSLLEHPCARVCLEAVKAYNRPPPTLPFLSSIVQGKKKTIRVPLLSKDAQLITGTWTGWRGNIGFLKEVRGKFFDCVTADRGLSVERRRMHAAVRLPWRTVIVRMPNGQGCNMQQQVLL